MKNLTKLVAKSALVVLMGTAALSAFPGLTDVPKGTRARAAGKGFCRYEVDGVMHCVGGVTEAECTIDLGGNFGQVPCPVEGCGGKKNRLK